MRRYCRVRLYTARASALLPHPFRMAAPVRDVLFERKLAKLRPKFLQWTDFKATPAPEGLLGEVRAPLRAYFAARLPCGRPLAPVIPCGDRHCVCDR